MVYLFGEFGVGGVYLCFECQCCVFGCCGGFCLCCCVCGIYFGFLCCLDCIGLGLCGFCCCQIVCDFGFVCVDGGDDFRYYCVFDFEIEEVECDQQLEDL